MSEGGVQIAEAAQKGDEIALAPPAPRPVVEVELRPLAIPSEFGPASQLEPEPRLSSFFRRHLLFIAVFVLPVAMAAVYLFLIATPRYASDARFIVRSTAPSTADTLQMALQSGGATMAVDDSYAVNVYLTSRDVLDRLVKNDNLREILARPEGDFLSRFPTSWLPDNNEFLYRRFQWMVSANLDELTNISTVEVNAFRPEDAHSLTVALLGYAEDIINQLNERSYQDALKTSDHFVALAQADVNSIAEQLRDYRNSSGMVDPNLEADSSLKLVETLAGQLAETEATIAQTIALTPNSPALNSLRERARSYRDQIEARRLEIAGASASTANKLKTYEQLVMRRELAAKTLEGALASRDKARQDAASQHLYIQLITQPSMPNAFARYPRVFFDMLTTIALAFMSYYVLRSLLKIASEHRP